MNLKMKIVFTFSDIFFKKHKTNTKFCREYEYRLRWDDKVYEPTAGNCLLRRNTE